MKSSKSDSSHDQDLDNRLAAFADQVLAGKATQPGAPAGPETGEDAELAELEETVLRLSAAVKAARPNPAAAARIEAQLKAGWQNPTPSRWEVFWQALHQNGRLQMSLAAALAVILLVAGLLFQPGAGASGGLAGAALQSPVWLPALLIFVVAAIVIIILKDRSR